MLKNLLAAVGAALIAKVGFDLCIRYSAMKEENRRWRTAYRECCRGDKKSNGVPPVD